jgi:hypothetical protein
MMSEQIIKVLDYLGEKLGIMIDWTSENAIPYVTLLCAKLVSYEIWTSVAWMVISIVSIACLIILIKKYREKILDDDLLSIFCSIIGGFLFIVCIAGIIGNGMDIIKCLTFPEMYVFEYLQHLINSGS